ncbi:MAG: hypothetical protein A2784_03035 [Candidatus Chisholmbacteria bacterium RIFCSPHIGHO2_01_FULL_48_12]|uniref:Transglutaminase-like domain-containing protein n=1 Tax=Candidatus Chisholmbacteria bacterium RIFCSPHIGHO2_01_FULL_48_12 TaxID=1797589 RepID=A0A1G1VNB7_9BACT|nr:MAG: hypothetical protein A2784_03035 [Candidatus Chisholmbacteria bacterium RIFCSPHIGHO2_01_FULL_48_12]
MRHIVCFLFLVSCFLLLLATPAQAAQEFTTVFNATYVVNPAGSTTVTQDITLTNKLSNIYASQYALTIGSTQITSVTATTPTKVLPLSITQTDNATTITINFPDSDKVVGKDQTLSFTITYQNADIANKLGRVLEVNIPKLANSDTIDNYTVTLLVPTVFDEPTLITPQPDQHTTTATHRVLTFSKDQVGSRGISALFGAYQNFQFNLRYSLNNPGLSPALATIALPPDTAYQQVVYSALNPVPLAVTADADGNWLARYQLKPQTTLEVTASGNALLYLEPTITVPPPPTDLTTYLQPQPFWPIDNPQIQALAQKFTTPETIYNYVVTTLKYNYDRVNADFTRLGALAALNNPDDALCTEFTDLFIAIARAAGIPAREANGFAFTANPKLRPLSLQKDVLHAWPEYYDREHQTWVPIDPTWGNTTQGIDYFSRLDLNHFTFVIHGLNSTQPYPAGAYKLADTTGKDVNIDFAATLPQSRFELALEFTWPNLVIKNHGNTAIHQPKISLSSPDITSDTINSNITIPPYGQVSLPVKFQPQLLVARTTTLTATVNDTSQTFTIRLNPPILPLVLGGALAAITLILGRLLVQGFKRLRPLRRQSQKP